MEKKRSIFIIVLAVLVCLILVANWSKLVDAINKKMIIETKEDFDPNSDHAIVYALRIYKLDNGKFPTTRQGLMALATEPTIEPIPQKWMGPYLKVLNQNSFKRDRWGNNLNYVCPGIHNKDNYDLWSYGPDGIKSEDDITNWD